MSEFFFDFDDTRYVYNPPTNGELDEHAAPQVFDASETASNFLGLNPVLGEYPTSDFYGYQYPFETRSDSDPVVGGQSDYEPDVSGPWLDARPDVPGSVQLERAGFASQEAPSSDHDLDVPRAYPPYALTGEVVHATHPAGYPISAPGSLSFTATFNVDSGAFWQPPNAIQAPQLAYNPYDAGNHVDPSQLPSFPPLPAHAPPSYIAPGPPPALATASSTLQQQLIAPASSTRQGPSRRAVTATGRPSAQCSAIKTLPEHKVRAIVRTAAVVDDATVIRCLWNGCGALVTLGALCGHMSSKHGCVKGMQVRCAWAGCTYQDPMAAGSLVKHLRSEAHLNIKTRCVACKSDFARPDALGRHLRSDAKGKQRASRN